MYQPTATLGADSKFAPRGKTGVFMGYYLLAGGVWAGYFLLCDLDELIQAAPDDFVTVRRAKEVRVMTQLWFFPLLQEAFGPAPQRGCVDDPDPEGRR